MSTESPNSSSSEENSRNSLNPHQKGDSERRNLFGLSLKALEDFAVQIGEKPFRGRQLFQWIYQKRLIGFEGMTNLNAALRDRLAQIAEIRLPEIVREDIDPDDGTRKFLVKLEDSELVEMVLIPVGERLALCMSSQVGCALGCTFCATGMIGFRRNLTPGEMLAQLMLAQERAGEQFVSTVVLMGMGEPLLNLDNVVEMIQTASSEMGLGFGARRFTISTVGLINGIKKLTEMRLKAGLALSLHAPIQELREHLIPVARSNPLAELIPACREYARQLGDRVTLEYLMIAGVTDTMECAKALAHLSSELPCKINLIAYNPIPDLIEQRDAPKGGPDFQSGFQGPSNGKSPNHRGSGLRTRHSCGSRNPTSGTETRHSGGSRNPTSGTETRHSGESRNPTSKSNAAGVRPPLPLDPTAFRPPTQDAIDRFRDYLYPRCPAVTFRQPKGLNIAAACGQLAGRGRRRRGATRICVDIETFLAVIGSLCDV